MHTVLLTYQPRLPFSDNKTFLKKYSLTKVHFKNVKF